MNSANAQFTKEMRSTHTILAPMMAPIQFTIIKRLLNSMGYQIELLTNNSSEVIHKGLKYVHNDTCYPALLVIGQMIDALDSGQYDVHKVALAITQTGGGCRASNYIHLLRKALVQAGYSFVPVISLNLKGLDAKSGFTITLPMLYKGVIGVIYGDALMLLRNQTLPYEVHPGASEALVEKWIERLSQQFFKNRGFSRRALKRNLRAIVRDFSNLEVDLKRPVVKVGIVGEIYMKYAALGNNDLEAFLASQSCEVMIPGLFGFILYGVFNQGEDVRLYGGSYIKVGGVNLLLRYLDSLEKIAIDVIQESHRFISPLPFKETIAAGREVISLSCKMGEGWLLSAEMRDLCLLGYPNIICVQPFGCLPNHIVGKGMIRRLRTFDPLANIMPIDYDLGASRVNQENRIKLMLAVANENRLRSEQEGND